MPMVAGSTSWAVNGTKNFWNQARRHMWKYNGIPKRYSHLFLTRIIHDASRIIRARTAS